MSNILIIGNGPAGISAAIYCARSGIKTTVIGKDSGALGKADKVENYYGFENPISGPELVQTGIAQAKRLGAEIIEDEVVGLGYNGKLTAKSLNSEYSADCIIIATGSSRTAPKIKGLEEFEGKGVSYCAVCDAFFYKGKDVAVLGCCEYALSEATELMPIANSVKIVTNGVDPIDTIPDSIPVITTPIAQFNGSDGVLSGISFEDGSSIDVSGIFIAVGTAGSTDLARKLGAETSRNKIIVDEKMSTNIPGLFAAGDCTGGMWQIAKAVCEGAKAGTEAVKYIRNMAK